MRRILATGLLSIALPASAATFTVTNTADSGLGSLRQAILNANGSFGNDDIAFAIPGPVVQTIVLASGRLRASSESAAPEPLPGRPPSARA